MTSRLRAKNIGNAATFKFRLDAVVDSDELKFILDNAEKKAWVYSEGQWQDISDYIEVLAPAYLTLYNAYYTALLYWPGETEWTYVDPQTGDTIRFYDIYIDISISDEVFQPD